MISDTSSSAESTRSSLVGPLAAVAAFAGVLALAVGTAADPVRGLANLLLHNFYFVSLALGALFFLAVLYLAEAGWFVVLRRGPGAMSPLVPGAGGLVVLVFFGREYL